MFELIWGILNGFLFIYFIVICFKSVRIVKENIGVFASFIFVIGFLSFISKSDKTNLVDKNIDVLNQTNPKKAFNGNSFLREITLEDNLTSKIELFILVGENEPDLILLNTSCHRSGFISGTNWNVENIEIDKDKNKKYCTYLVRGIMEWKLLGITIYSEHKSFNGNALLKKNKTIYFQAFGKMANFVMNSRLHFARNSISHGKQTVPKFATSLSHKTLSNSSHENRRIQDHNTQSKENCS